MSFEVGDQVAYNPRINGLLPNVKRPHNVGIITAIDNNYATVKFPRSTRRIFAPKNGYKALTHYSGSAKGLRNSHRNKYRSVLANIPMAREGMEARRVWDERVNLPFKYGPGSLFSEYYPKTVDPERTTSRLVNSYENESEYPFNISRVNPDGGKRSTKKRSTKKRVTRRQRR